MKGAAGGCADWVTSPSALWSGNDFEGPEGIPGCSATDRMRQSRFTGTHPLRYMHTMRFRLKKLGTKTIKTSAGVWRVLRG